MRYAISLLVAAAFMASGAASAQVFKCKGAGGKTVYSDAPCQDGAPGVVVNTQGNVAESDSTRAVARGDFEDPGQRSVQPQRGAYAPAPAQQAKPIDQIACKNANRDLDLAKSKMSLEISRGKHPGHCHYWKQSRFSLPPVLFSKNRDSGAFAAFYKPGQLPVFFGNPG